MIYEYRVYDAVAGRLPDVISRFRDHTVNLLEKHGAKNIGYWTSDVGGYSNQLIYILAFDSVEQREVIWKNFRADPEWAKVVVSSEANGPIVAKITNMIMNPTDFSQLK